MKWYFHACPVCAGDLHDEIQDPGWVTCFMCARSFPLAGAVSQRDPARRPLVGDAVTAQGAAANRKEARTAA